MRTTRTRPSVWRRLALWGLSACAAALPAAAARAEGDAANGRELAIKRCSRCHVIGDYNRLGGIGSTPSFTWMVRSPDYLQVFRAFYTQHPHPVFVRVPGYPRWSKEPPYYPEFKITPDEVEDIVAYVTTLRSPQ